MGKSKPFFLFPGYVYFLVAIIGSYFLINFSKGDTRVDVFAPNGKAYRVIRGNDEKRKAEILANIDERVEKVLSVLQLEKKQIVISENDDFREFVAFTMNKTDIRLCLKTQDLNTLMFVTLHELAHAFSKDTGHSSSFWELFSKFLQTAISLGVYEYQDFSSSPESYCGESIYSTPYHCPTCKVYQKKSS